MKVIKYQLMTEVVNGTEVEQIFNEASIVCTADNLEANEEIAKLEAYNGEYTVEDDGIEEIQVPSQLDRIESQLAYLAMMTDNAEILEV